MQGKCAWGNTWRYQTCYIECLHMAICFGQNVLELRWERLEVTSDTRIYNKSGCCIKMDWLSFVLSAWSLNSVIIDLTRQIPKHNAGTQNRHRVAIISQFGARLWFTALCTEVTLFYRPLFHYSALLRQERRHPTQLLQPLIISGQRPYSCFGMGK